MILSPIDDEWINIDVSGMNNDSRFPLPSVMVDFPREIRGCRPHEMGRPFDIFGFSCRRDATGRDVVAPRGTYFATRHHQAFRIECRANHSTHAQHRIPTYHATAVAFFPSVHIVHDATFYISLCCVKCLSPRYTSRSRDALLQYVRVLRYVLLRIH